MTRIALRVAAATLAAISVAPAAAQAAQATWTPETLSPDRGEQYEQNVGVSTVADGSGRATAVWSECHDGRCDIVARTRPAASAFGALRTLSTADEHLTGLEHGRPRAAVNGAGDVAAIWPSCNEDQTSCGVRLAVKPRGLTTWAAPVWVVEASTLTETYEPQPASPAVTINDEGDVTVAWERPGSANNVSGLVAATYRNEDSGYAAEPHRDVQVAAPVDPAAGDSSRYPVLATRTDGTAVMAWHQARAETIFQSCYTTRVATQRPDGTWTAPRRLDDADCSLNHQSYGVALARDGDGVLAVYDVAIPAGGAEYDWKLRARHIGADDALGTPALVTERHAVVDGLNTLSDQISSPLLVGPAGSALLAAYSAEPAEEPDEAFVPTAFVREGGTWSETVLDPADVVDNTTSVQHSPQAALEADGTGTVVWTRPRNVNGDRDVWAARRAPGGAWSAPSRLSDGVVVSYEPVVAAGGSGPTVAAWWGWAESGQHVDASVFGTPAVNQAPTAGFDVAPAAPKAGETVTFASTSGDADGTIAATGWDLDDDGDFTDATGATAHAVFPAAGTYTVELEVVDDDGERATASRQVLVAAEPTGGGGGSQPPAGGGGGGGPQPQPQPGPADPPAPFAFVVQRTQDTTGARKMPAVTGRALDDANAKVLRALTYADIKNVRRIADEDDLPKRPGGGSWKVGDVVAQAPASGSSVTTSTTQQAAVTLTYWAGEKGDRSSCRELRSTLKQDDLDLALAQLKAAGCGSSPDLVLVPSKKAASPVVSSVAKDGDLKVTVPTDPARLDITTWKTSGVLSSSDPGPVADDFSLTAGQNNTLGVSLRDRAGRRLQGAKVRYDLHEVGGKDVLRVTDGAGVAATTVRPAKAGTIHVLSEWADGKGERIYGYAAFEVVKRTAKSFTTVTGRTYTLLPKAGYYVKTAESSTARAAGIGEFFAAIGSCLRALGGQVAQATGGPVEQVIRATTQFKVSTLQLWRGSNAGSPQAAQVVRGNGLWFLGPNGVVAAGSGNVVAAGSANVVAAGSANVIAAGGGNLISDNGLGVVAAGGGNLVTLPDGAKVVAAGSANVVSAGSANVVAAGGGNVVAAGGLN